MSLYKLIKQRLPDNMTVLENAPLFSMSNVLQPVMDFTNYCYVMVYLSISGNSFANAEYQLQSITVD